MTAISKAIGRTPLDGWLAHRIGVEQAAPGRLAINAYQLRALRETIAWARANSTFYARHLKGLGEEPLLDFAALARISFTTPNDLIQCGHQLLCVSQDKISRVVSFTSSGTTGLPKRIFFTEEDQERALEFFAVGVTAMAVPGERMLIALPGEREGSVGYQVAEGIARAGVVPVPHGLIYDPVRTLSLMDEQRITSIIGFPVQMLALVRHPSALANDVLGRLRSMVLCSDYVPRHLVEVVRGRSDCEVFAHYGTTEMGLGGGVDCRAHMGYHMREADLFVEIVSPETGEPVPDGETGEVVFTTLNRTGMPLIRYRTGDISRILPGLCGCGSAITRLDGIQGRITDVVVLGAGGSIGITMLDEALFAAPDVIDFRATFTHGTPDYLTLTIFTYGQPQSEAAIRERLAGISCIAEACATRQLWLQVVFTNEPFPVTGAKRTIAIEEAI